MVSLLLWLIPLLSDSDIEGRWVTIDDETSREKSEILLYVEDGKLYGKIETSSFT